MEGKNIFRFIRVALLLAFIVCMVLIGRVYGLSIEHKKYQKDLKGIMEEENRGESVGTEDMRGQDGIEDVQEVPDSVPEELPHGMQAVMDKLMELYTVNNDMVGGFPFRGR